MQLPVDPNKIKQVADAKNKEAKIKPRCSSCAIIDFGEHTEGYDYLEKL